MPFTMLTIALAQMNVLTGQPDANLARARDFAAQARDAGADLREIHKARRYLTVYGDRRPDAYRVEPPTDN